MINGAIFRNAIRGRSGDWKSLLGFGLMFLYACFMTGMRGMGTGGDSLAGVTVFFDAFLIAQMGRGMIGEDLSSGSIAIVFSRPVRRADYALSKWAALSALGATVMLAKIGLIEATFHSQGASWPAGPGLAPLLAAQMLSAAGIAAVVLLCDALAARGWLYLTLFPLTWAIMAVAALRSLDWLAQAGRQLFDLLAPQVDPSAFTDPARLAAGMIPWASTLTAALVGLIWFLNRREMTHAPD